MSLPTGPPPVIPGFTLVGGIGSGGFADVFLYQQEQPARPVAVKVLRTEHLSAESLRRFAAEADAMALVSAHPHIVTIHTSGVAPDGRPYIVMEHYPGPHLGLRARTGDLGVADVLRVGVQVASAVETAHRAGILHRDIKPANILTSAYDKPGLTDFGISAVAGAGSSETTGAVTLAFAAPEVLSGRTGGSVAADVYGLCATLHCLLAGHAPAWVPEGDNGEAAMTDRVLRGDVARLERPDVPPALRDLLARGLALDPGRRPASPLVLADALRAIEHDQQLGPTALEIRDDLASAASPERSIMRPGFLPPVAGERTSPTARRSGEGGGAPAAAVAAPLVAAPLVVAGAAAAPGRADGRAGGERAEGVLAPTVLPRRHTGGAGPAPAPAPKPEPEPSPTPPGPTRPTRVIAAVAVVALVVAVLGAAGLMAATRDPAGPELATVTPIGEASTSTTAGALPAVVGTSTAATEPATTSAAQPVTRPAPTTTTRPPTTPSTAPTSRPPPTSPSDASACTTGGCAARATWVSNGEHLFICDNDADSLGAVAQYSSGTSSPTRTVWNRNGNGTCIDQDLNLTEGATIRFRVCVGDEDEKLSRCSGYVSARA